MEVGGGGDVHIRKSGFPVPYLSFKLAYNLSVRAAEVCDAPVIPIPRAM